MAKTKFRVHYEMENGSSKYKSFQTVDADNEINAAAKAQQIQKIAKPKYQFTVLKIVRI